MVDPMMPGHTECKSAARPGECRHAFAPSLDQSDPARFRNQRKNTALMFDALEPAAKIIRETGILRADR